MLVFNSPQCGFRGTACANALHPSLTPALLAAPAGMRRAEATATLSCRSCCPWTLFPSQSPSRRLWGQQHRPLHVVEAAAAPPAGPTAAAQTAAAQTAAASRQRLYPLRHAECGPQQHLKRCLFREEWLPEAATETCTPIQHRYEDRAVAVLHSTVDGFYQMLWCSVTQHKGRKEDACCEAWHRGAMC